ncbi:hypothetical protein [Kineococcus esterisolvens]
MTSPNFVNSSQQPQRSDDEASRARVERVRARVDPGGVFAADFAAIRD